MTGGHASGVGDPGGLADAQVPDRIDLGDVVVRVLTAADAPAVSGAMVASYDELHPWMSWATPEGVTPRACADFIARSAAGRRAGTDLVYGIFDAGDDAGVLGSCGLHTRVGPDAVELGYWLRTDATGRGLMTRVAGALTDLALDRLGFERVEIHCDAANTASAAIPRRLGYTLVRTGPTVRPGGPGGSGRHQFWMTGPGVVPGDTVG